MKAQPPEMLQQVSAVELNGSGTALYLHANLLIGLSRTRFVLAEPVPLPVPVTGGAVTSASVVGRFASKTTVTVIDIQNRSAPRIARTITLDGDLRDSRLIDGNLHLILSESLPLAETVTAEQLDAVLPRFVETMPGISPRSGLIAEPTDFYRPADISGSGDSLAVSSRLPFGDTFTTVATIDLDDQSASIQAISVFARSGILYASRAALYLASTACRGCAPFALQTEVTEVHKIALTEAGPLYVASGGIPGRPRDQFSFSEHKGFLRVATTSAAPFPPVGTTSAGPSNNVFVLRDSTTRMEIVGRVENIAAGETIRSALFVGDRGFLVTFRQVDPLFTLDLGDPTRPRLVGELKIPGFSTFMLPISGTELLAVGRDADPAGRLLGLQLSLFDVSDFAHPILKDKAMIGGAGSDSEALFNPKAFTYFPARQVLALPIRETESQGGFPFGPVRLRFVGLVVYRVDNRSGFQLLGRIATSIGNETFVASPQYTRGVFIGDDVYAVTPHLVRAGRLGDLNSAPWSVVFQFPFSTVASGQASGIEEARQVVVRDQVTWETLWSAHAAGVQTDPFPFFFVRTGPPPVPTVDFSREMVIGIFLGTRSSGGFSVTITSIVPDPSGKELVVHVEDAMPGRSCAVTQALTHPFHLVKLARSEAAVSFEGSARVVECIRSPLP